MEGESFFETRQAETAYTALICMYNSWKPQIVDLGDVLCGCRLRLRSLARTLNANCNFLPPNRFQALYVSLRLLFRFCQYLSDALSNSRR